LPASAWHSDYTTDKIIGVGFVDYSSLMFILNKIEKLRKYYFKVEI